jgi:DNA polymerase-3 subunit beta
MFESQMEETSHPQVQLISRLIEGEYPNYKEIIPAKHITQIILDRSEFLSQIKTASLFSGKINEVKVKTDASNKNLEISSQSAEIGKHESSVPIKFKGEPVNVSFNYKYLMEGVANIKSSEIIFELNGDAGPGLIKPVGDDSYIYVVMPIKNN